MNESILTSVKAHIGITEDETSFDNILIDIINTTFSMLSQFGRGLPVDFKITGATEQWSEYLQDEPQLNLIKTYVNLRTSLIFDPPATGPQTEAINRIVNELEWRIATICGELADDGMDDVL